MEDVKSQTGKAYQALGARLSAFGVPKRLWSTRGVWLGGGAWLLALWALSLLGREPGRTWAMLFLALAGVLAVIAWEGIRPIPGIREPEGVAAAEKVNLFLPVDRARLPYLIGIGLSALLALGANLLFVAQPGETFGLAGVLWLFGIASLVISTWLWPRAVTSPLPVTSTAHDPSVQSSLHVRRSNKGRAGEWRLSTGPRRGTTQAPEQVWTRWEVATLAGLFALALILRVWNLQEIPFPIHPDEILTGWHAQQGYIRGPSGVRGEGLSVFGTAWEEVDLPGLWFLQVAASLSLGGTSLASLRLPAALYGALTLLPFYGLVRGIWGRAAAIAGSAIFAFSAANVHYSRITLNNIVTLFFWTTCFFFLLRGLRSKRPVDWALAGIAAGLGEYTYYATRLLPFLLLVFVGYLLLVHWRQARSFLAHIGLLALAYVVAFGPLLAYFLQHPGLYFASGVRKLTWDHVPGDLADLQRMWDTLWPLMANNLLGFSTLPSVDYVYHAPLLISGEAALLLLGSALLLRRWRHPGAFLLLLTGGGVLFVGGTLVSGAPFLAHWTPAFQVFYAAIGAALGAWAVSWSAMAPRLRVVGAVILAVGLLGGMLLNMVPYFRQYYSEHPDLPVHKALGTWIASLGPGYRVYTAGRTSSIRYDPDALDYLPGEPQVHALLRPYDQLPLPEEAGIRPAFVFFADNRRYKPVVQQFYPSASEGEIHSSDGRSLFYTYIPSDQ